MKALALVLVALVAIQFQPATSATPIMDIGCPDPPPGPSQYPLQTTRCDIAMDTDEFLECKLEFARSLPGLVQQAINEAIESVNSDVHTLKCYGTNQTVGAVETFVWHNPPVACYVKSTTTCGWNNALCNAVYPATLLVWVVTLPPRLPPPMPCVPGQPNCVPPSDPMQCVPPYDR